MSNQTEEKIKTKTDQPETSKKSVRIPWNGVGLFISTLVIIGFIFIVSFTYCKLISVNMLLAKGLTQIEQHVALIQAQVKDQQNQITQLGQSAEKSNNYWKILEAHQFIMLANDNLQLTHDVATTIKMLKFASQELQISNDARLNLVQRAIAADIEKLKSISPVDTATLFSKIVTIDNQIIKLPLKTNQAKTQPANANSDATQSWWQRGLHTSLNILSNIVIIRRTPKGVLPIATPEEQAFLYQYFHSLLAQTNWALLYQQNTIYHTSLQQIINWVEIYFVTDVAETKTVLADLQQLQQVDLNPAIPELTAMNAFQDYFAATKQGV